MTTDAKQNGDGGAATPVDNVANITDNGVQEAATFTLDAKQLRGVKRPVIHVLTASGRKDEFKDRGIVIPDCGLALDDRGVIVPRTAEDPADDSVWALLINGKGEPYYTPDGHLAVVDIPVVGFAGVVPNPNRWLDWKETAKRAGVSKSTAKRMVAEGKLPKPVKLGERRVGFKQGEVDAAVARLAKK